MVALGGRSMGIGPGTGPGRGRESICESAFKIAGGSMGLRKNAAAPAASERSFSGSSLGAFPRLFSIKFPQA